MTPIDEALAGLDEFQRPAVTTDATRALCVAGAGSGKTTVLVTRAAWLIDTNRASPTELLMLTFTRKAAANMRTRLEAMIGPRAGGVTIGTFHSVCYRMLRAWGDRLGLRGQQLTVYSERQRKQLMRGIAEDLGFVTVKTTAAGKVRRTWKAVKSRDLDRAYSVFCATGVLPAEGMAERLVMDQLFARCRENNAMTFGMLLSTTCQLLTEHPDILAHYQNQWRHVLVDEYQDTDHVQYALHETLAPANLFVVADPRQSIYGWRGADVEIAEAFGRDEGTAVFQLRHNYRSRANIVTASNRLIAANESIAEPMLSVREDGGTMAKLDGTSRDVARAVQWLCVMHPPGDVAVLARTHFLLRRISDELTALDVPHDRIGSSREAQDTDEWEVVHGCLRLIVNPYDNLSFMVLRCQLGIDGPAYNQVRSWAAQEGLSHFSQWQQMYPVGPLVSTPRHPVKQHSRNMCWTFLMPDDSLADAIETVGCWLGDGGTDDAWAAVFDQITAWETAGHFDAATISVADYLQWLALFDEQDDVAEKPDCPQLMTIHAAKGLEFHTVVLAAWNEGLLPNRATDAFELAEERRLAYVAITRAMDAVVLNVRPTETTDVYGNTHESPPSRFVAELGDVPWETMRC